MREAMGYATKDVSDHLHKELKPAEVFEIFKEKFENLTTPYEMVATHFTQQEDIFAELTVKYNGEIKVGTATGNGRLNAVSNAMKEMFGLDYKFVTYQEHALEKSSSSRAIAYVGIENRKGELFWGAGVHQDIIVASISGLITAINNMVRAE